MENETFADTLVKIYKKHLYIMSLNPRAELVTVKTDLLGYINIDKEIFSKVFGYILDNSVVYSNGKKAFVDIELKELGFNYLISVKDMGIGIPDIEQDFVFEKFAVTLANNCVLFLLLCL